MIYYLCAILVGVLLINVMWATIIIQRQQHLIAHLLELLRAWDRWARKALTQPEEEDPADAWKKGE
jgi:hypothetical protein